MNSHLTDYSPVTVAEQIPAIKDDKMNPTRKPLRCLIVEDSANDAELLVEALRRGGYEPAFARVQTPAAMRAALCDREWDVVFSDYAMPAFDAPSAFRLLQERRIEIPFIIVSGEIGEDTAVESLKFGADDYLLKHNLKRLIPALERALKDKEDSRRADRAEQALQRSEETFRLMVEQVLEYAIFMLDPDGRVTTWNAGAQNINGYTASEIIGKSFSCFYTAEDIAAGKPSESLAQARTKGHIVDEGWRVRKDGSRFWAHVVLTATRDSRGNLHGFTKITHDLTERRRAEEERRQIELKLRLSQKLEAIGRVAAGIAHEINTPIQFAQHNLLFLQESFAGFRQWLDDCHRLFQMALSGKAPPELAQMFKQAAVKFDQELLNKEFPAAIAEALRGTERVAKIVHAMKEFSHPGTASNGKAAPANLNQAIETSITVARNEWKYVAEVVTDFDPAMPPVPMFVVEFNQVILNLLVNAAHAIAESPGTGSRAKGTITVSTRRNGKWAEIRVRDTGAGIPENIQHRIFEPFFTTKAVGKGTGQGLALAHSIIVERHRGELHFETEKGKGTCFIISLPLHPPLLAKKCDKAES